MLNKVILHGRLVADPELRHTPNGVAVCNFRVAVDRDFKDKQTGERKADFVNVVGWRQTAEFVSRSFVKGQLVLVEGRLQNNEYTDKNGVRHTTLEVDADDVYFGDSKKDGAPKTSYGGQYAPPSFPEIPSNEPLPFEMGGNPFDQLPL